ncbi:MULTISPECIES: hypothetical protein [unclassified Pseudomonas]|uniref:hypothetical protein n=1 Tax=unclassified Pseudomonas TaxID=196821 RepID=UPI000CD120ED|nr:MULTISPECIES: hypothetical protein [unclassified Pseudomonas]POA14676.1 hypothetical protein C1892_09930 [Pseudomonas sp. MPBD7-1]
MNKIHWFCVSNPDGKSFPERRRSYGVSDGGLVFVPAAMAGDETEMNVILCASGDGQSTSVHLDHHSLSFKSYTRGQQIGLRICF